MATSADRDERDEDEKTEAAEDKESAEKKDEKAASTAAKADAKPTEKADDEDEDEDEDDEPAPKPAAKRPPIKARGPGAARARKAAAPPPSGSLGKSVLLFFVIVIGLGAGFAILGRETPQGEAAKPKWKVGEVVDVEITVVKSDRQDLSCASAEEVGGKHCAFEALDKPPASPKPWSKGDVNDDKKLLKPYTTVDRIQFAAAGLWTDPALSPDKLPATRFSVKCKYKVEGNLKELGVRWNPTDQWYANKDWYAGSVSDCKITQ